MFKVVFLRPVASHAIDYDCTARTWGDAVPSGRGLDRSARTFGFLGIPISIVKTASIEYPAIASKGPDGAKHGKNQIRLFLVVYACMDDAAVA